jgi:hypothetical protein
MKHWQLYIALILLVVITQIKLEGYTNNDTRAMNQQIKAIIYQNDINVKNINNIIDYIKNYITIPKPTQYNGPKNFSVYFENKDMTTIHRNIRILQNSEQDSAVAINIILLYLGLNPDRTPTIPPIDTASIHSTYSVNSTKAKYPASDDFVENDLINLKEDIAQLKQITQTNANMLTIIFNQYAQGNLPNPTLPYPKLAFNPL